MAAGLLGATRRKVEEATELFSRQMPPFLFGREALAATCNGAHQLCTPFGSEPSGSNGRFRTPPIMENLPRGAGRTPRLAWPHPPFQRGGSSYRLTNVHGTAANSIRLVIHALECLIVPNLVFSSFELVQAVFQFLVAGARITASSRSKV